MAAEIDVTDCNMTDDIDSGLSAAEQRHRVEKQEREEELIQIRQPRSLQRKRSRSGVER